MNRSKLSNKKLSSRLEKAEEETELRLLRMARRAEIDEGMHDTVLSRSNSSLSSLGDDEQENENQSNHKRLKTDNDDENEKSNDALASASESNEATQKDSPASPKGQHDDDSGSTEEDAGRYDDSDDELEKKTDEEEEEEEEEGDEEEEEETRSDKGSKKGEEIETPNAEIQAPPPVIMYYCAYQGCRSVDEFECLNKIEEGAYGVVYRAKDKKTNEVVALKRLKMEKEKEGFPITSLREVDILLKMQHPNIVTVREIVVGNNMDKIYMAMEYVEHDLKSLMQHGMKKPFMTGEVKTLMQQLLSGIAHLHDNWIIHRDLKTSNLLLSHKGILKIADFGLAREYGSPLKEYTPVVVTLWYRSPELLLNTKKYSTAIDMWSVGCIFGELMLMKPLFNGKNEKDQLDKIFKDLGTPNDRVWPEFKNLPLAKSLNFPNFPYNTLRNRFGNYLSNKGFELINKLLTYDPDRRISAEEALKSEYFKETPLPVDPSIFPTWPAKSEGLSKPKLEKDSEPRAPSAGKMYEQLVAAEEGFVLRAPVLSGFNPL